MRISEKIHRLRIEHDLTQAEFGRIAGVSDKAVSTWELGYKEPRIKPLQKICAYFEVDINQFIDTNTEVYKKTEPAIERDDGLKERLRIFKALSPEAQAQALDYMRYLAEKEASDE